MRGGVCKEQQSGGGLYALLLVLSLLTLLGSVEATPGMGNVQWRGATGHHLHLVFGSERLETHFVSSDDLEDAVQDVHRKQQEMVQDSASSYRRVLSSENGSSEDIMNSFVQHIACVHYASSPKAKEALISVFGSNDVSTVHSSESSNRACFLVSSSTQHMAKLLLTKENKDEDKSSSSRGISSAFEKLGGIDFSLWTGIPSSLKLHPSTFHYLGLLDHHPQKDQLLSSSTLKNPHPQSIDLSQTQVLLTTIPMDVMLPTVVSKLQNHLLHQQLSSPTALRDQVFRLYGEKDQNHLWSLVSTEFENNVFSNSEGDSVNAGEVPCHFSSLNVKLEENNIIIITGLHIFSNSSQYPTSCFASLLAILAMESHVVDIRLRHDKHSFNNYIKSILQSEVYNQGEKYYPYLKAGLNGSGQVVGVGDSGIDELSCFFNEGDNSLMTRSNVTHPVTNLTRRKVVQYVAYKGDGDTTGGHGTHVSGTVAGSVLTSPGSQQSAEEEDFMRLYGGHAPAAKISFFDMSEDGHSIYYPSPLASNVFEPAAKAGAHIHTNSWGGPFNFYDSDTLSADKFQTQHDDFLVIFAAGNDGSDGYFSVADPAVSKNSLTVGASMTNKTIERVAFFSSLGPTFDQRFKPDVIAPGYFTSSACASGNDNITCKVLKHAGTSMATPAVAGTAAIIRQYFSGDNENLNLNFITSAYQNVCQTSYPLCKRFLPRGATVKAIIIHSGEAMEEYYTGRYNASTTEPTAPLSDRPPDMYQGFGRVTLPNVLPFPGVEDVLDLYVEELEIFSMQELVYDVVVEDNSRPLKVTMVWMDPVNHVISSRLLLHDIDLRVVGPSGEVYHGNNQPGDEMNNVEQVYISVPSVNVSYEVYIQAKVFSESARQNMSLVITSGVGVVSKRTINDPPGDKSDFVYNALICSSDEQMVVIRKADRGGDGWEGGYFIVEDLKTGFLVMNSTMHDTASKDIIGYDRLCMPFGIYNISLHRGSETSTDDDSRIVQWQDMGVTVQQCGVYLSEYQTSAVMHISSSNRCNPCGNFSITTDASGQSNNKTYYSLQIALVGSLYGVPYGWKGTSKYVLFSKDNSNNNKIESEGTLLVGMLEERTMCLPADESYELILEEVPVMDDFLDDDWLAGFLGVEEYQIGVSGCNNTKYWQKKIAHPNYKETEKEIDIVGAKEDVLFAKPGHTIYIQVGTEGRCEMHIEEISSTSPTPFPWYLEILITVIAAVFFSGCIISILYWKGIRPMTPLSVPGSDEASKNVPQIGENFSDGVNVEEIDVEDEENDNVMLTAKSQKKKTGIKALTSFNLSGIRGGKQKPVKHKYVKFSTSSTTS